MKIIYQTYIPVKDYSLVACISLPEQIKEMIILFPGFSHSKSDMDFYLSDLRNNLLEKSIGVVQVDLYGCGDSVGDFSECSLNMIYTNVIGIIQWISQEFDYPVSVLGRGIIANVLADERIASMVKNVILINSIALNEHSQKRIKELLSSYKGDECIDMSSYIVFLEDSSKDLLLVYMYALGAEERNIKGLRIALSTLQEFCGLVSKSVIAAENVYSFQTDIHDNLQIEKGDEKQKDISFYRDAFVRSPVWISNLISHVVEIFDA